MIGGTDPYEGISDAKKHLNESSGGRLRPRAYAVTDSQPMSMEL